MAQDDGLLFIWQLI